jgi:hypothetical protein
MIAISRAVRLARPILMPAWAATDVLDEDRVAIPGWDAMMADHECRITRPRRPWESHCTTVGDGAAATKGALSAGCAPRRIWRQHRRLMPWMPVTPRSKSLRRQKRHELRALLGAGPLRTPQRVVPIPSRGVYSGRQHQLRHRRAGQEPAPWTLIASLPCSLPAPPCRRVGLPCVCLVGSGSPHRSGKPTPRRNTRRRNAPRRGSQPAKSASGAAPD